MRTEEYNALVQAARETDLVAYFQRNGFTVERKGSEFYVKEYPSLCIKPSTNQWYFHYTREGATNNSINCLTKVLGMDFNQAVFSLTGQDISMMRSADYPRAQRPAMTSPPRPPRREPEKKELQMPEQSEKTGRLFAYLCPDCGATVAVLHRKPKVQHGGCRQGRRLCPRNGTKVKCSCFDKPNRLVKTDIGWRQSKGALFERFHKVFTE